MVYRGKDRARSNGVNAPCLGGDVVRLVFSRAALSETCRKPGGGQDAAHDGTDQPTDRRRAPLGQPYADRRDWGDAAGRGGPARLVGGG